MKKRVTLVDIAKRTGVSVNCVSRALMDASYISDSTKSKIKKVADELGYVPNLSAASLKKGNSKIVGILYDNLLNTYYNTVIYYLHQILSEKNYSVIIYRADEFDEAIYKEMISRNLEGLISFLTPNDDLAKKIHANHFPTVIIGRKSDYLSSVCYDDNKVGYLAGKALLDMGYQNPVYLGEVETLDISRKRAEGFLEALKEKNILGKVIFRKFINEPRLELLDRALTGGEVDSIFCFSDHMAFWVMRELLSKNLSAIKVIGVDNIQQEIPLPFSLTTIGQDKNKMALDTIGLLFNQIEQKEMGVELIIEDVYLVDNPIS